MAKQIHFLDVGLNYKKRWIFSNFNFNFIEGIPVCLIGSEASGKSSLLKMVKNEISYTGSILCDEPCEVILDFHLEDDISIYEYLNIKNMDRVFQQDLQNFLKLKNYSYSVLKLNEVYQLKVCLCKYLFQCPRFLFVDDFLHILSLEDRELFFQMALKYGITLFYVTSSMEDVLFFPYLVVLGRDGILLEGSTLKVLKEEKIMKRLGYSLPFIVDLSLQLISYELITDICCNFKELRSKVWK